MFPVIVQLPLVGTLKSFGFFVAAGFLTGMWWGLRLSRRYGEDPEQDPHKAADVGWWILIGAIAGGRIGYVVVNLGYFLEHPLKIFALWEGGLVMYGGLILAAFLAYWKIRRHGLHPWLTADYGILAGFLGQSIGRFGCLAVGDDYGRPTEMPWGITYPNPLPEGSLFNPEWAGIPVHPTQLYLSLNALGLFLLGSWMMKRRRFKGQVFAVLVALYAVMRFLIEIYRGDSVARGGIWTVSPAEAAENPGLEPKLLLSSSQLVSMALLPLMLGFYLWLSRRPGGRLTPEEARGRSSVPAQAATG